MQAVRAVPEPQVPAYFSRPKNNLIGKEWVPAQSGKTVDVADPSTGRVLLSTPDSAKEDVHKAALAARRAFDSGPWPKLTPYERGRLLLKLADLVEKHQEELAQIESVDAGKPIMQARYVDVPLVLHQLHFYAGLTSKIGGGGTTPPTPDQEDAQFAPPPRRRRTWRTSSSTPTPSASRWGWRASSPRSTSRCCSG